MTDTKHDCFIRLPDVRKLTSLSTAALYELMAAGEFPRPRKLTPSGAAVAWRSSEIQAWMEARPPALGDKADARPRRGSHMSVRPPKPTEPAAG